MHASKSAARGFTLIEVLAALVIVSLGMLGVIEAVGQTASNSSRMRDRTLAHWVAMNRLTTARLETRAPNIGKTSDEIEMAGRRWRWTMEVQETPVASMRRIDIRVGEAGDEDDERSLATVTGFYGTAIAAAGLTAPSWSGTGVPGGPGGPGPQSPPGDRNGDGDGDRNEQPNNPPPGGEPVDPPQEPNSEGQE
jgi:general secretion pathway protein I